MSVNNNSYDRVLYPLTHPQKRVWYVEKIYPCTSLHNVGGPIRIKGKIDFVMLEKSIKTFVKRNDGVRLRIVETDGEPRQYINDYNETNIDFVDFSRHEQPEKEFAAWVEKEAGKPFKLEDADLFYFAIFKIAENDGGYNVRFHHIISDGWSINIMTEQICDTYMKLLKGEEVNYAPEPSYIDYIEQENNYLLSSKFEKSKAFWNKKFSTLPESLPCKNSDSIEGKRKTFKMEQEISLRIKEFCQIHKFSLNTLFIALLGIYLNKTTRHDDISIGTPVLNRSGKKEKKMFGMFTSTMPFRFTIEKSHSVLTLLREVSKELMSCYFNQKYPYNFLVQDLELKKKGYDGLFSISVNYYNTRLNTDLNGAVIENVEAYNGKQIYFLQIVIKDWSDTESLVLDFDYKVGEYSEQDIERVYVGLTSLISQVLLNADEEIKKLRLLPDEEWKRLIYDFNSTMADYPMDKTIYQLFEEQVERTPEKIAICYKDSRLTYRELNQKANQLARVLDGKGVTKETIVGLMATHSLEAVIGILGILKAGAAYLPVDPDYPGGRINYMLDDSGASILLTNCDITEDICFKDPVIDLRDSQLYAGDASNVGAKSGPANLAYIIYTSGSTGKPKGAMIGHKGLVNYIWWAAQVYLKGDAEVFALYSSLSFDLTVTSIFTPLISGNRIVVYRDDGDEYVLFSIMKDRQATVVKLTPSHLSLLKDMNNRGSSVKRFIVGGEDLKVSLSKAIYDSFEGDIEIYNEYGPTETVVGCMTYKYNCSSDVRASVPIGVPAHNVQIYILDETLEPVPVGCTGELYISGDGVARGYRNRSDLTSECFIDNPFIKGRRMYKTGDVARFIDRDLIEYIGRADRQVKIRGYRIELGEIERVLFSSGLVKDAIVKECEENDGSKFLCAYIVAKGTVASKDLRHYLSDYLPEYMIPQHFVFIDKVPLTANGKVNMSLLQDPKRKEARQPASTSYNSELERILIDVMSEVLSIKAIQSKDNFFQFGGDSIKAIGISAKLHEKGLKIRVKDILANPVISQMALYIQHDSDSAAPEQGICSGYIKPTPITSWFFSQSFKNINHYNQSVLLKLNFDIAVEKLELILDKLVEDHDSLRINYHVNLGELYYNNEHLKKRTKIEVHDLSGHPCSKRNFYIAEIGEKIKSSLSIEDGLLFKACLFDAGQSEKKLLLTAHHLVIDGVSWRIILEDFYSMLIQSSKGQTLDLPQKTHSYQKWALAIEEYSKSEAFLKEQTYWENINSLDFAFNADFNSSENAVEDRCSIECSLTEEETGMLLTKANYPYNTQPKDLLIISLALAMADFSDRNNVVLEIEGHGREDIFDNVNITRTVGWLTSIYPASINVQGSELSKNIKAIKEQLANVPHKGLGYGILKYISKCIRPDRQSGVRFNYLGDFNSFSKNEIFELLIENTGGDLGYQNNMTCLMDINEMIINSKLNISITYDKKKFKEESMISFKNIYLNYIRQVLIHCCNKEERESTPSDINTVNLSQEEIDYIFA